MLSRSGAGQIRPHKDLFQWSGNSLVSTSWCAPRFHRILYAHRHVVRHATFIHLLGHQPTYSNDHLLLKDLQYTFMYFIFRNDIYLFDIIQISKHIKYLSCFFLKSLVVTCLHTCFSLDKIRRPRSLIFLWVVFREMGICV